MPGKPKLDPDYSAKLAWLLGERVKALEAQLAKLQRDVVALWYERRSIAALVDREPRLATKFGLLAKWLGAIPRQSTIADAIGPDLRRALAFAPGRDTDARSPLEAELREILATDPRMAERDLREAMKKRAREGVGIVLDVRVGLLGHAPGSRKRNRGLLVVWRHPMTGREKRTAWSSISNRLGRVRRSAIAVAKARLRAKTP
jgi:hypothetical protein